MKQSSWTLCQRLKIKVTSAFPCMMWGKPLSLCAKCWKVYLPCKGGHFLYATFYFGHCKDFYMDQARNSSIYLIIVGGTIMWRGCSRKLFRAGKPQREREADARTFGWIWLEKVRGGRWRCIWAELQETRRKDWKDEDESKHAKIPRDVYEDVRGGCGGIRCNPWRQGGYGRWEVVWEVHLCMKMWEGALGRNRGHCRVARPHEMPLVN